MVGDRERQLRGAVYTCDFHMCSKRQMPNIYYLLIIIVGIERTIGWGCVGSVGTPLTMISMEAIS